MLVATCPACLVPIVNVLWESRADVPEAEAEAREIVRDALLEAQELCPTDFLDEGIRDVLAEDLGPVWLASLGAIRHLWIAPSMAAGEAHVLLREHLDAVPCAPEAARWFWDCLRIARSPLDEATRHEARRRMKRLSPQLHGLLLHQPK